MVRRRRKTQTAGLGLLDRLLFGETKKKRKRAKTVALEVDQEVSGVIWAIVFFTVAILLTISFFGGLGILSGLVLGFLAPIFGWGIYLLPVASLLLGFFVMIQKKAQFNMARILGVFLFLTAFLSILHLAIPIEQATQFAREGSHGGFVGYALNYIFQDWLKMSRLAAAVVFVALFMISILLMFEQAVLGFLKTAFGKEEPAKKTKRASVAVATEDELLDELDYADEEALEHVQIIKPDFATEDSYKASVEDDKDSKGSESEVVQELPLYSPVSEFDEEAEDETTAMLVEKIVTWESPPLNLLSDQNSQVFADDKLLKKNAEVIRSKLEQFGIKVIMKNVHVGPTVTQYTLQPSEGVKLSKITSLKSDLALALAAKAIRIEAPIPGQSLVGIEVPADDRVFVYLKEILLSAECQALVKKSKLTIPLGRDVSGKPMVADIANMPHLLIAGATGAGKSVGMNVILLSLLYQNSPSDLRLILIDPKRVELLDYNGIPHLLTPVITEPEKAANALSWCVSEMMQRYETLAQAGCRNIDEYNGDEGRMKKMPKIVVVIDELADLMLSNGKDVEQSICRIAQMARAVGIHLIVATQRPSVDVITGLIKANIPTRISFAVTSSIDSRTILDGMGAEDLLGQGDMLYLPKDLGKPVRVQGVYVSSAEIKAVTNKLKLTMEPDYRETVIKQRTGPSGAPLIGDGEGAEDDLYHEAMRIVVEHQKASASLLQRRLKIGYARAARILDLLEENGVIGPVNGAKPRQILIK